jgi:hypothetical protein
VVINRAELSTARLEKWFRTVEAAAALMVWYTWHLQTPVAGLAVLPIPVLAQPHVHNLFPAIWVRDAPAWNRLQAIKYTTYQKIKLGILNLKRNQYSCIYL